MTREGGRWRDEREPAGRGIEARGQGGDDRESRQSHCDDRDALTSRGCHLLARDLEKPGSNNRSRTTRTPPRTCSFSLFLRFSTSSAGFRSFRAARH